MQEQQYTKGQLAVRRAHSSSDIGVLIATFATFFLLSAGYFIISYFASDEFMGGDFSLLTVMFGLVGVAIVAVLFFAAVIIMPYQKSEKHNEIKRTRMKKGFFSSYRPFTVMMGACLMMLTTHNILCTYLLQIIQSFGGNSSNLGTALAIQAIVEVPVMFCFSRLLRHFSPAVLMMTASFGFILKAIMFLISSDILMLYLTQLTQMVSFALFASASVYYTAESVSDEDQGMGQACMTSMMAAGTVCGSLLGGWILKVTGIHELLLISLLISAFGVILAAISVRMGRHKTPAEEVSRYE